MSLGVEAPGLVERNLVRSRGVVLHGFPMSHDLVLDVTMVNPLQQSAWLETVHMVGITMGKAKVRKRD